MNSKDEFVNLVWAIAFTIVGSAAAVTMLGCP